MIRYLESNKTVNNEIIYEYDKEGDPVSFVCEEIDEEGKVVGYDYEGYGEGYYDDGNDTDSVVYKNHLRYRGYYFDEETGWYYLNNRYYNPRQGRFINCDEVKYIGQDGTNVSYNLYAYCGNNPVIRMDSSGSFWHIVAGAISGGIIGAISSIVGQTISGQQIGWAEVGISMLSGALTGVITSTFPNLSMFATGLVHGLIGAGSYAATELVNGRTPTVFGILVHQVLQVVFSLLE